MGRIGTAAHANFSLPLTMCGSVETLRRPCAEIVAYLTKRFFPDCFRRKGPVRSSLAAPPPASASVLFPPPLRALSPVRDAMSNGGGGLITSVSVDSGVCVCWGGTAARLAWQHPCRHPGESDAREDHGLLTGVFAISHVLSVVILGPPVRSLQRNKKGIKIKPSGSEVGER